MSAHNQDVTLLASAARTVTANSPTQYSSGAKGVILYLNVTAVGGTGGLRVNVQGFDPASQSWVTIASYSTNITATGMYLFSLYPGNGTGGVNTATFQQILPATWRVQISAQDSSSYTYSLGASVIR